MKQKHIFVFFISLLASIVLGYGQSTETVTETDPETEIEIEEGIVPAVKDTTKTGAPQYYGLRIGADIAIPIRTLLDQDFAGFEIVGDFRIKKNLYLAAEIGNITRTNILTNLNNTSRGSYIKAGANLNVYENWFGMNNLIYIGGRVAFSSFSQELNSFTIATTSPLFGDDTRFESREFNGLNTTWLEFQLGLQTELFSNLYLGVNVQLKRSLSRTQPENFELIFIPGFGETTDGSQFGAGFGYTLSYLIPIFKR